MLDISTIGLLIILIAVLACPFAFKFIEHHIEIFLFIMGLAAALLTQKFNLHLLGHALSEPVPITLAVLAFGLLFKIFRKKLDQTIRFILKKIPIAWFIALIIFILGLASSIITAIIAALILTEVISLLPIDKQHEKKLVILACYAIGLGAVLTPIGEPLSTITLAKLKGLPGVDFWYLAKLLGLEVILMLILFAGLSFFFRGHRSQTGLTAIHREETYGEILLRSAKVFLFVMALIFLGSGFQQLVDRYVIHLSADLLYWINMISAVLDNATLAATEISPNMDAIHLKKILMGLLISGGMLIPGNIPNIIAAAKLKISMKDWAKFGAPLGLVVMLGYFLIIKLI
ncbi:MAG: DUF1646 family protein [Deltaproteobacteria bacterium]|nr:DUF1646 family protein [Deltaproteobacteria bacterium]